MGYIAYITKKMQEESESEEEILVYAEFDESVNIDKYRAIHVLGEGEQNPIIQLDETFFMGMKTFPCIHLRII